MYKTYIDNTVFFKKQEYHAHGWITAEHRRIDSIFDIYDEDVSVVQVLPDGKYYAPGTAFDRASFIASLLNHIDYDNHVEDLGERLPYNNGADLEDDTHA